MSDFQSFWARMPVLTKYMLTGSLGCTLLAHFGFFKPQSLILIGPLVYQQFQIWRLLTCFAYFGGLGFGFLIDMIFLYRHANDLETNQFQGRKADFLFMLLFGAVFLLLIGMWFPFQILGRGVIFMMLYYWSRKNEEVPMSFFGVINFKGIYLPWFLIGLNMLLGGSPWRELAGILVGHLYFYLFELYPLGSGHHIIRTPAFLQRLFSEDRPYERQPGFQQQQQQQPLQQRGRHQWGEGRTLGSN